LPNRQKRFINIKTPRENCIEQMQPFGSTERVHAPVVATTVFNTPDDGRRKRPKHVA
jgi:hypothetical protein